MFHDIIVGRRRRSRGLRLAHFEWPRLASSRVTASSPTSIICVARASERSATSTTERSTREVGFATCGVGTLEHREVSEGDRLLARDERHTISLEPSAEGVLDGGGQIAHIIQCLFGFSNR